MVTLRSIATAVAGVALFFQSSTAHSVKRNPVNYVTFIDDPVIKAPSHRVSAVSTFDLLFTLHDGQTPIRLALEPNADILHQDFSVTYLGPGGQVREVEKVPRTSHRIFKGRAFVKKDGREGWSQAGWARITVHRDGKKPLFEGAFKIFGDAHHISTGAHYRRGKHEDDPVVAESTDGEEVMVVYRDSDIQRSSLLDGELKRRSTDATCNSDSLGFNTRYDLEMRSLNERSFGSVKGSSLFGRQSIDGDAGNTGANYYPYIGSTTGCPTTRKVALVGIATDCNYWSDFDGDREELRSNVIDVVNRASGLYEDTFKISLGIKNLTMIEKSCSQSSSESAPWNVACSNSVNLNDRLNLFSSWRGQHDDTNAYWSLLTTCNTGSAVGLAWRGQLCREGSSSAQDSSGANETVAATNVVVRGPAEWQIFAHETGHTFGAVHDCTEDACPQNSNSQTCCPLSSTTCDANQEFIMNPSTGQGITEFSPCSIGNICSGLMRNIDGTCLTDNQNVGTITGSQCGNGIVEEGEDCDCGGSDDCGDNNCCNADTCKFRDNAQCDPTNEDCCTDSCRFASSGTVCRESTSDCDPEEKCPGDSGKCPADEHLKDGESCGDGLSCASGQCTSRDEQCQSMFGSNSTSSTNDDIEACGGGDTCILTCSSPTYQNGQCVAVNQNFLDGTDCGGGGRCDNGNCKGSSTWGRIQEWFRNNKNIAIPVGCVIGALLLLAISCCIFSSCRRRRRAKKVAAAQKNAAMAEGSPPMMTSRGNIHDQPYHGQQAAYTNGANGHGGGGTADDYYQQSGSTYQGHNESFQQMDHPPQYSGYAPAAMPHERDAQWQRTRTSSMRYA